MKNKDISIEINIKYKDDEEARNKLIDFIINFVIENSDIVGDNHE